MHDRSDEYDVAVIGLGAMGSATLHHLAQRGVRAIGFDRWHPPHDRGSTHGRTRIIREAYFEHPLYVPLVQRAYALWDALARDAGVALFRRTGGLMIGPPNGTLVTGARHSASVHDLPCEELDVATAMARFPAFVLPPAFAALHEPRAGILDPEGCVRAHLAVAARAGATIAPHEPVLRWTADTRGVAIATTRGSYRARRAVLSPGAWLGALVPAVADRFTVERQVMHWFAPRAPDARFDASRCPIAMIEYAPGRYGYMIPDTGHGVKAAIHHEGVAADPDTVRREVDEADIAVVEQLLDAYLPLAHGRRLDSAVCLYTNTSDGHFVVDRHPELPNVVIVSACSGHGFKFASAIGELAADLAGDRAPAIDPAPFALARFAAAPAR